MDEVLERLAKEAVEEEDRRMVRSWAYQKGIEQGIEQGRLAALRESLWTIVELRGLEVDDELRAEVDACCDADQLHRWLVRLKTSASLADALDP